MLPQMMPMPWVILFFFIFLVFYIMELYFNYVILFLQVNNIKSFSISVVSLPW